MSMTMQPSSLSLSSKSATLYLVLGTFRTLHNNVERELSCLKLENRLESKHSNICLQIVVITVVILGRKKRIVQIFKNMLKKYKFLK